MSSISDLASFYAKNSFTIVSTSGETKGKGMPTSWNRPEFTNYATEQQLIHYITQGRNITCITRELWCLDFDIYVKATKTHDPELQAFFQKIDNTDEHLIIKS